LSSLSGCAVVAVNPELRGTFLSHIVNDSGATLALARPWPGIGR